MNQGLLNLYSAPSPKKSGILKWVYKGTFVRIVGLNFDQGHTKKIHYEGIVKNIRKAQNSTSVTLEIKNLPGASFIQKIFVFSPCILNIEILRG